MRGVIQIDTVSAANLSGKALKSRRKENSSSDANVEGCGEWNRV